MVPGPRVRESRSPLDSRPLDGKPSRGLFLLSPRTCSGAALHSSHCLHGSLPLSCRPPCRHRLTRHPKRLFCILLDVNALFRYLIILFVLCCGSAFGISYPVSYGTASKDTVYVVGQKHQSIVVERGCRSNTFKQDSPVDENSPRDSLLARVYGNVPYPDSAGLYNAWADDCEKSVSGNITDGLTYIPIDIIFAAFGVYFTFLHNYDHVGTAVLGRTFGVISLLCVPMLVSAGISHFSQSSKQRDLGKFYRKESERFSILVSPAINYQEPGGGVMLQVGF